MKKLAFVTPWFGEKIPGGAEMALRGITQHLFASGINLEILTTCVKEFSSDWNENFHKPGEVHINGIPVKRFSVSKRDVKKFDEVNYKLINHIPITKEEELIFIQEMVNSPDLYKYIEQNVNEYELFIYIPYMFGTTYFGVKICPDKSILIPCFHDESYMYLGIFKELFSKVAGMIFNAKPECVLANQVYDLSNVNQCTPGLGLEIDIEYDENRFRQKYNIQDPFILYAGRKDVGKNVDLLIKYFIQYKKRKKSNLKLVLLGGGTINIPDTFKSDVLDLGFLPLQDKYDAYSAALCLCQPSINESFSLVIMESWLCHRPVIVHNNCEVTKHFVKDSNGGLYFADYWEFEGCIEYLLNNPAKSKDMGNRGNEYVRNNFDWNIIIMKYKNFFSKIEL
ncbi:Glycosyltransferase involved in cell wall bisynthesis [Anaerocolumna jejuensis DSM 15929]|uniref:Glycosyltransferase involved in cell wall bisynthesis n=1 Tax=Anaerocolumna jejuensis DSM 15929 TaxID=1121322 RepID=A0A1M6UFE2_9FIRM|nr:glycosyltransferase [Anaerocolumna jejuensis]SHK67985.1 Glycosyltransferase involved in cell wall bisynthesis [Anaerocolumna jejuensis DSM 15929]